MRCVAGSPSRDEWGLDLPGTCFRQRLAHCRARWVVAVDLDRVFPPRISPTPTGCIWRSAPSSGSHKCLAGILPPCSYFGRWAWGRWGLAPPLGGSPGWARCLAAGHPVPAFSSPLFPSTLRLAPTILPSLCFMDAPYLLARLPHFEQHRKAPHQAPPELTWHSKFGGWQPVCIPGKGACAKSCWTKWYLV